MSKNKPKTEFEQFVSLFPEVELPITLSSEYFDIFSKYNKPIPELFIYQFIDDDNSKIVNNDFDDDLLEDEYIACLKIPELKDFNALVYLRIGILKYEYFLHTFDNNGKLLSKQLIASMTSDGDVIEENVAFIDEDLIILIMEGDTKVDADYSPENSKVKSYEINDIGKILKYKL